VTGGRQGWKGKEKNGEVMEKWHLTGMHSSGPVEHFCMARDIYLGFEFWLSDEREGAGRRQWEWRTELPLRQPVLNPSTLTGVLDSLPIIVIVFVIIAVVILVRGLLDVFVDSLALASTRHVRWC
jgi:hypothetical protein